MAQAGNGQVIDVSEVIDRHPLSAFQITVIVLCVVVAIIDGFDALSITFAAPLIAKEMSIPIASFGPIFGAGTLGLTLGALGIPPLADRFGRKSITILACVIFGVLSLLTIQAHSFGSLALEYAPKRVLDWVPDERTRHKIFVANPAELFGTWPNA